jgi:aspartate kinase
MNVITPIPPRVLVDTSQARIVVENIPDRPGTAAAIFSTLAEAGIAVDLILENYARDGRTTLTFTLPETQRHKAFELVQRGLEALGGQVLMHGPSAKLRVAVDHGATPAIAARLFQVLARAEINIDMISTAESEVSVVIAPADADRAAALARAAFAGA